MSITSMSNRARMAEDLTIQQLQQSIQDGVVPSYIGVPLLKSKVEDAKLLQAAKAAQNMGQQQSVAQQIMSQAQQVSQPAPQMAPQAGVEGLSTNLPTSMAGGGIVAFAEGGMYDEEDSDEDRQDAARQAEMDEMMDEYAQSFQTGIGQLPAAQQYAPASEGKEDAADFVARIMHKESRGRRYGKDGQLLTSEKGAQGEMQVMPGTSRDPGFGVKPARDDSPDELARVGRDYANTLLQRYGDPKLAAIAYNMGPGATDKWLAAGADVSKLPKETQGYVKGFSGEDGKSLVRYAPSGFGNTASQTEMTPEQLEEAKRLREMGLFDSMKETFGPYVKPIWESLTTPPSPEVKKQTLVPDQLKTVSQVPAGGPDLLALDAQRRSAANQKTKKPTGYDMASEADDRSFGVVPRGDNQGVESLAAEKPDPYAKFETLFAKREENLAKQREQDKYMAMLQAGLGMMGGTSQHALTNIGAGATQGIQSLAQANAARTAEENALLSGRLGLAKIGSNKEYQDAMMAYRKDLAKSTDTRARDLAKASLAEKDVARGERSEAKTYKLLSDIEDKIRAGVAKDVAGNVLLQNKPDVEQVKEQMVQERLRAHKTYGRKYQEYFGEPAFDGPSGGKMDSGAYPENAVRKIKG